MADRLEVKELDQVVVRFSGDSGDGMQLAGNIFSTVSATVGNDICTFPDYPADIRAPQGSLTGVSGFQVHIGAQRVYTPGDKCDVLVAMNAAALKTQYRYAKSTACIIIDTDCFQAKDLQKAAFTTDNPIEELGIKNDVIAAPITQMVKACLADSGMDNKAILKCRNMFALGLVCWLFNRDLEIAFNMLREKFAKKPAVAEANIKVIQAGYDYGANTHASVAHTYKVESKTKKPGKYMDIMGNKATAYGFIAAAEKAGKRLFLGSYPITPATDVLHELSKHKSLGVTTVQCEDEIAGCASSIGASFAGALAVTSTSGPGVCLIGSHESGRDYGIAVGDTERAARRPVHGLAHEERADGFVASPFRTQRRIADAGHCSHFAYELFRCGLLCLEDGFGAHDAGGVAHRCFCGQRFRCFQTARFERLSRYLSPLRHSGNGRELHAIHA